jgi:hypothetical protein
MNSFLRKIEENDFFRVVCIGDAQSAQTNTSPNWSDWMKKVVGNAYEKQKEWRFQLINTAANGATPKHIATYLTHYVTQFKPDLVVVSFGNAALDPMFNERDFIAEFTMLMQSLQKIGCEIAIWSPLPQPSGMGREASLAITTFFEQIAKSMGVNYVDVYHEFEGYELGKMFQDGTGNTAAALNQVGNFVVARKLLLSLFSLSMPQVTAGDFQVHNLEQLRKWGN